ncbi:hypothetical protein H8E77_23570 [bacterium]|nr:hypothetical protein [bacterium]
MKFSKETFLGFSMGIAFCLVVVFILAAKGGFMATTISIPQVLSYQGYLTDINGVPISGTKSLTFTIYDKDGNPVWDETTDVDFDDGQFCVYLGEQNPIDAEVLSNPPISLGIKVDGGSELQPPHQLASVAYAVVAAKANDADTLGGKKEEELNVDKVDGYDASDLLDLSQHEGTLDLTHIPQGPDSGLHADLLDSQHGPFYLNRANHTGTQAPSTISPQGSGSGLDADMVDGKHDYDLPNDGTVSQAKLKTAIGVTEGKLR